MFGAYRPPQREDPEPHWTPVRWIDKKHRCTFCRDTIWPGKPGTRTGDRGTKAWRNSLTGEWECLGCRSEAVRANEARVR